MKLVNTREHRSAGRILALSALLFAWPMGANAQWQVINLHPAGATLSGAIGVAGGLQVGRANVGGIDRASLWSGTAKSWVNLHPAGMARSYAMAVEGGLVAGMVIDAAEAQHASLWSRVGASWMWEDVDDSGAPLSNATDVDDGVVVGYAGEVVGFLHARLWYRVGNSWASVDLHPAWAAESQALGANGGRQVGYVADAAGVRHASVWCGSPETCVDLNPAEAEHSSASDVDGDQVVGNARVNGLGGACLWNRAGDSWVWVNLHPLGLRGSAAAGVDGGEQVGLVVSTHYRAALWRGSPDSYVDLHAFLPREFEWSMAVGISHDGSYTYVVGYGWNGKRQRQEALMWRKR